MAIIEIHNSRRRGHKSQIRTVMIYFSIIEEEEVKETHLGKGVALYFLRLGETTI